MLCWGEFPAGLSNRAQCKIPTGTQRSGHGGKRRSKGAGGAFPEREEAEQSGLCDDADGGGNVVLGGIPSGIVRAAGPRRRTSGVQVFLRSKYLEMGGLCLPI